jgi:hypothetical protein
MQRGFEVLARALFGLAAALLVASCGSGAVGSVVVDPTRITVQPGSDGSPTTLYSGLPTTFTITGGTGTYIVSSSNQAVVPVSGPIVGNTLTVIPNPVVTDTSVVLTARDTGTTTPTSVTLLVRPGTVSNMITIAPGSSACAPAICSGGDAVVTTTISQGGIPLPARGVRFDVISGDVRFITSPAGAPETTALSVTTVTDETGAARARLRALDTAANQTAIIQITDLGSGAYQRTTVLIARASAGQVGFFTVPESVTFTGPDNTRCATGLSSEIFIFGGAPPYTISNSAPAAFLTNTNTVNFSGGSFRVTTTGICASNVTFAVTDAAGRTSTVTLSNQLGSNAPPPAPLGVFPGSLTLTSCSARASAVIVGGKSTSYVAASENSIVLATVTGSILTVSRAPGTFPPSSAITVNVNVSDGTSVFTVPVTLTGTASAGSGTNPGTTTPNGTCP